MLISNWSPDVCSSDLRVVERRALEPGAVAVDLLEVLGDRSRRQPTADLAVARCELRRTVGIEQPGRAGLAAGDVAVRQPPVVTGPGRRQRARPRRRDRKSVV